MTEQTKTTIACRCGSKHEIEGHPSSIGNRIVDGWNVAVTMNMGIINLCPPCYARTQELAEEIYQLTGSRYVSLAHLSDKDDEDDE